MKNRAKNENVELSERSQFFIFQSAEIVAMENSIGRRVRIRVRIRVGMSENQSESGDRER